jgi:hypothetical protein
MRSALLMCLLIGCVAPTKETPSGPSFGELTKAVTSTLAIPRVAIASAGQNAYDTFAAERGFAVGDLNGDGSLDIFVAPSLYNRFPELPVRVWLGQGDGTFVDGTNDVLADVVTTGFANGAALADFNSDGRADVFIFDQGIEYPDAFHFPGARNKLLLSGPDGRLHDASANIPVDYNAFSHPSSVADLDGNGCVDVVVTQLGGAILPTRGTYVLFGDCHGGFTKSTALLPPEIAEYSLLNQQAGLDYQGSGTNLVADLDGDGRAELVTGTYNGDDPISMNRTLRVYQRGSGAFAEVTRVTVPSAIAGLPYFPGGNLGGAGCAGLVAGDLDGDDRPEIVALWETYGPVYLQILHNDGGLAFSDVTEQVYGAFAAKPVAVAVGYFRLIDVDRDGRLDLVRGDKFNNPTQLIGDTSSEVPATSFISRNVGDGTLEPWRFRLHGAPATLAEVEAAFPEGASFDDMTGVPLVFDANNDGVNDVVIVNSTHAYPDAPKTPDEVRIYTFIAGVK